MIDELTELRNQVRRAKAADEILGNEAAQHEIKQMIADAEADLWTVPIEDMDGVAAAVMHWKSAQRFRSQLQSMSRRGPDAQVELERKQEQMG